MLWNVSGISPATGWARFCLSVDPEADLSLEVWNDVETHFVDRNRMESMFAFVDLECLETQIGWRYNLITFVGLLDRWLRRQIMRNVSHSQRSALLDSSPLEQKLWKMKKSWMKNPSDFYIEVLVACTLDANVMPKWEDDELKYWCQFDS